MLNHLSKTINLFYMPEIHEVLVPLILELFKEGNNILKETCLHFFVQVLKHQHHLPYRDNLIEQVITLLAKHRSQANRRLYIKFMTIAVLELSRQTIQNFLMDNYCELRQDKQALVRKDFADSLTIIKPFFDFD